MKEDLWDETLPNDECKLSGEPKEMPIYGRAQACDGIIAQFFFFLFPLIFLFLSSLPPARLSHFPRMGTIWKLL